LDRFVAGVPRRGRSDSSSARDRRHFLGRSLFS
jgi:hypothetical protein